MRLGAINDNAVLSVSATPARQPVSLKAPLRTRFSRFQGFRAIRAAGRAVWSFWLDESCNVPDRERYCSTSPAISNFAHVSQRELCSSDTRPRAGMG
jgi:hypothetical protein